MGEISTGIPERTIGLDVSDKYTQFMVLSADGDVLEEGRVRTTESGLSRLTRDYPQARIALEVGTHSGWISRAFLGWGHNEVAVANAAQLAAISQSPRKSDRHDAEMLARLARSDVQLLRPIQHRTRETQLLLTRLRARRALVESRTKLVNAVRGMAKSLGVPLPKCSAESFHKRAPRPLPADVVPALQPLITMIGSLTLEIRRAEGELDAIARGLAVAEQLRQVPSIGVLTALAYVLTIENPWRFRRSRDVPSYIGLTPRRSQSGERDPQLGITKAGSTELRMLLIQAAHYTLGPFGTDTALRRWGLKVTERRGKRTAVTAVARKLAVLLHRLWVTGARYDPQHTGDATKAHA